jgi:hypothetical protein
VVVKFREAGASVREEGCIARVRSFEVLSLSSRTWPFDRVILVHSTLKKIMLLDQLGTPCTLSMKIPAIDNLSHRLQSDLLHPALQRGVLGKMTNVDRIVSTVYRRFDGSTSICVPREDRTSAFSSAMPSASSRPSCFLPLGRPSAFACES